MFSHTSQAPIHFSEVEETFTEPPLVKFPRLSESSAAALLTVRKVPPCLEHKVPFALEPLSIKIQH
jgi:serine/threonine protein kinase